MSDSRSTIIVYQGNAQQTQYAFPFDYLRKSFVKVGLIDEKGKISLLAQGEGYSVIDHQIILTQPTTSKIRIFRSTSTTPLISWADASVFRALDLSVQETQLLHLVEEALDAVSDSSWSKENSDNRYWLVGDIVEASEQEIDDIFK